MAEMGGITTVEHQGFRLDTNSGATSEEILERLNPKKEEPVKEEPDLSKAASELGKKGGEAAAKKRAEERKSLKAQGLTEETDLEQGVATEKTPKDEPPAKEDEGEPEKLGNPRHDPKARMLEATRKEAEAKRERDAAKAERDATKAEADALRRERDALKAQSEAKPPVKVEAPNKPLRANFPSDEDYVEAIADWKAEEKVKAYRTETEQAARVKEFTGTIDGILAHHKSFGEEHEKADPGWRSKMTDDVKDLLHKPIFFQDPGAQLTADNFIADEIYMSGDKWPLLAIHLSENPEELKRIRDLRSAQDVQVEMRILTRTLKSAAPQATAPKSEVSKALPPVRPVTGAPHNIAEEGHTPERASRVGLDEYSRGWKPPKRR